MRVVQVDARNLSEAWFRCCREVILNGHEYAISEGSFEGHRRKELDVVVVHIERPGERPLSPSTPPGVVPPTSDDYINEYLLYLMTDQRQPNELYTYGEYLAPQIEEVIQRYRQRGYGTNQLCMNVGDQNSLRLEHPPCLRLVDTRVRYGALHFIVYFRSWDLWAGFPTNLGGLQLLKEYMADSISVADGEIIAVSKGLHLYDYAWEHAKVVGGL